MTDLWSLEPKYREKWSKFSYLKIKVSMPGIDTVVAVNATLDLDPFFGCVGQIGRDVLDALQIRFWDGEKSRGFLEEEGEFRDWLQMSGTISLKHFRMTGPLVLQMASNHTILFGDFLKNVPTNLSLSDVSIPNFSLVHGVEMDIQKRVFLSHSHKDKRFARALALSLQEHGIGVWIDEAEINIGESLIEKLRNAIDEVDFVVAVISSFSINSEWVKKELDVAMNQEIKNKRIKVLPILIEDCVLPGFLEGKLFGDFRNSRMRTKSIQLLVRSITSL